MAGSASIGAPMPVTASQTALRASSSAASTSQSPLWSFAGAMRRVPLRPRNAAARSSPPLRIVTTSGSPSPNDSHHAESHSTVRNGERCAAASAFHSVAAASISFKARKLASRTLRIAVYSDFPYRREDGAVYAEQAFALFLAGLAEHLEQVT